ncbi:hypothetical protein BRC81_08725 [Halobacteriales archaeon QS_1_68_20]|nr:MAG: hypothetical protein BRC81_08725 [Halobacteriales archaeon QS_1_68_20]
MNQKGVGRSDDPRDRHTEAIDGTDRIDPTDAFEALSERERQYAVHYLAENDVATLGELAEPIATLGELAEPIAGRDDVPGDAEGIATALHHGHLPKLDAVGLVDYDPGSRTVTCQPELTSVTPYLPESAVR